MKKKIIVVFIILFIALALEILLFNYRAIESRFFYNIKEYNINYGKGIDRIRSNYIQINDSEDSYIELSQINRKVKNIFLNIEGEQDVYDIQISFIDDANEFYFNMPSQKILYEVEDSKYIRLYPSGNAEKIKINFLNCENEKIIIHNIELNKEIPIKLCWERMAVIILILGIVYIFRYSSFLWKIRISDKLGICKVIICAYIILQITLFWSMSSINPWLIANEKALINQIQYWKLTEAIFDKKVNVDIEVTEELKQMENPYDYNARTKKGIEAPWDYAYYDGKFYVYFGVVPVLLIYIPWYLITGTMPLNHYVIMFLMLFFVIGVLLLLKEIALKYVRNVSVVLYLIMSAVIINGCGTLYIAKRPDFYSIPILMGLTFTVYGLYFWIKAIKNEELLQKIYILLGSLCMALVAGCRPQLLLGSFLIIPLLKDVIIKKYKRGIKLKNTILEFLCLVLPYMLVAIGLMYYNYIRFDSVFDFGANYNLTSNDMTKRGWVWARTGLGLFVYLFQPPTLLAKFPFLYASNLANDYQGNTIMEILFGGMITSNLILLFGCGSFKLKNILMKKRLYLFNVLSIVFAMIIVIVDTQMAGLLIRYTNDFGLFLFLPTVITIFVLMDTYNKLEIYGYLRSIVVFLSILSLIYNSMVIFASDMQSYQEMCPVLYYKIAYGIQFWL